MQVITTEKIPIKIWTDSVEEGAMQQARNMANLPFAFHHVALMPDVHEGYGMPIGGVLATRNAIIPNAVGVDIGCGMCAVRTQLQHIQEKDLKPIMSGIRRLIPLGFKHHKKKQDHSFMPEGNEIVPKGIVDQEYENARDQIGTLGGGNHFIEIQRAKDGSIWIMVHSGSRNIGHKVAEHYNKLAQGTSTSLSVTGKKRKKILYSEPKCQAERSRSRTITPGEVARSVNLAYLPLDSEEALAYQKEMQYCVDFAFANRKLMMARILEVCGEVLKEEIREEQFINIAHNFAHLENHFRENVIVHRKGATSARKGQLGIIPGSQGTNSFIVRGKGNPESFHSCSHGAGRVMGRKQAQRSLDLKQEKEKLDRKRIIHSLRSVRDLDEAPGAYKNINQVIRFQEDLVEVVEELEPLAVVKG